jgi:hypothetical protein
VINVENVASILKVSRFMLNLTEETVFADIWKGISAVSTRIDLYCAG